MATIRKLRRIQLEGRRGIDEAPVDQRRHCVKESGGVFVHLLRPLRVHGVEETCRSESRYWTRARASGVAKITLPEGAKVAGTGTTTSVGSACSFASKYQ